MAESDFLGFPIYILPDIPEGHELFFHVTGVYEYCGPEGEKPFGKWVYDKAANAVKQTAPNGDVYVYRLGGEGNLCEAERHFTKDGVNCCEKGAAYVPTTPSAKVWKMRNARKYNSRGQCTEHLGVNGYSETAEYDAEGRILSQTVFLEKDYLGRERKYIYSEDGKLAEIRKNERNIGSGYGDYKMYQYRTVLTYDADGRKIAETEYNSEGGVCAERRYGDGERLLLERSGKPDHLSTVRRYEYDAVGRLKRYTFEYDGAVKQETKYSYPADGSRIVRQHGTIPGRDDKFFPKSEDVFNSAGRLVSSKRYRYDSGELTQEILWEYDENGEPDRRVETGRHSQFPERWQTESIEYGYLSDCKVKLPLQYHDLVNGRVVGTTYAKYCRISPNIVMGFSLRDGNVSYISYDEYDSYGNEIGSLVLWDDGEIVGRRSTFEPFVVAKGQYTEEDRQREHSNRKR